MATAHRILLLTEDQQRRDQWSRELEKWAHISTNPLAALPAGEADGLELIITDHLPMTEPLGPLSALVATGEVAVVAVGTHVGGDVVLPEDCSGRELRLACQLMVEIVRLRRAVSEERRRRQALQNLSERDPLTHLANRRRWDRELAARLDGLRECEPPSVLAVVLLDLDLFKGMNDQYGHVAGDLALQRAAHQLVANLASHHLAARLGGDEFGVLLSGLLESDVPDVTESLRRSLEHQIEDAPPGTPPVTASAGVVVVRPDDQVRPLDALRAADRALRNAKQQGRKRTAVGALADLPGS